MLETRATPGGHEIDFDRFLLEELAVLKCSPSLCIPRGLHIPWDHGLPCHELSAPALSYNAVPKWKKMFVAAAMELRRLAWFNEMAALGNTNAFDAMIVPTASHRFLRSLRHSRLNKSKQPVLFIMHGITPADMPKVIRGCDKIKGNPNLRVLVISLTPEQTPDLPNLVAVPPPIYVPKEVPVPDWYTPKDEITLGFFGQYRREKNLDGVLDAFASASFSRRVRLMAQGSPATPEDRADFLRLMHKYEDDERITFIPRALIGREWQEALAKVDALLLPYGTDRYKYQCAAMLFTAMGFRKPVLAADMVNPSVFSRFPIGKAFSATDPAALKPALEQFVNTFDDSAEAYRSGLESAAAFYSQRKVAAAILATLSKK